MTNKSLPLNPEYLKIKSWKFAESISEEEYLKIAQRSTPKSPNEEGQCSEEETAIFQRVMQLRSIQRDTKPSEQILLSKDTIIEAIGIYIMDESSLNTYDILASSEAHIVVSYDSNHCAHYFWIMFPASERVNPDAFCSKYMYLHGSNEHRIGTNNFMCFRINKNIVESLMNSEQFVRLESYAFNNDFGRMEMDDWWYNKGQYQGYNDGPSYYCEACGQSPCMCSDREQTSTTHEW
jgi:hypothetical protein